MLRVIRFLAGVSVTFYIAIIYKSNALIYLGFAEIVLGMLCFFYAIVGLFSIKAFVEVPFNIIEAGQKVSVRIRVQNSSIVPSGKIKIILEENSVFSKKKRTAVFCTAVEGKGMKKSPEETTIMAECSLEQIGKTEIRIKKVLCFDLTGVFAFSQSKKKYGEKAEIVVMPELYDVPLEIGNHMKSFVAEQESYRENGENDSVFDDFEIREYRPGDKIRSIYWKISAKSDELMVCDYKIKVSCPVLFFLDVCAKKGKKKLLQRQEKFCVVFLSVSAALIKQNCSHYVIWYDERKEGMERFLVEKEDDIYILLRKVSFAAHYPQGFLPEEDYFENYHEQIFAHKLVLNSDLVLSYSDEIKIVYDVEHLKESMASQEIFLN